MPPYSHTFQYLNSLHQSHPCYNRSLHICFFTTFPPQSPNNAYFLPQPVSWNIRRTLPQNPSTRSRHRPVVPVKSFLPHLDRISQPDRRLGVLPSAAFYLYHQRHQHESRIPFACRHDLLLVILSSSDTTAYEPYQLLLLGKLVAKEVDRGGSYLSGRTLLVRALHFAGATVKTLFLCGMSRSVRLVEERGCRL